MKNTKVAIVVLNWHGAADTICCLKSLMELSTTGFSVFVVDNASTDDSLAEIRDWVSNYTNRDGAQFALSDFSMAPVNEDNIKDISGSTERIILLQAGRNGGYAAGNNVGLRLAMKTGFDYFWILNNDTEVHLDALQFLLDRMVESPDIGICGSTLVYSHDRTLVQARGGAIFLPLKGRGVPIGAFQKVQDAVDLAQLESKLRYVIGASMFVSRKFVSKVGLMAEHYFLYWEELDWATRGRSCFKLGYAPNSLVYHKVGASIGTSDSGVASPLSEYYMTRGRLKYCIRYSKISIPFVVFETTRTTLRWLARSNWRRAQNIVRSVIGLPFSK
jgi:GT2 family glycosyltransferase